MWIVNRLGCLAGVVVCAAGVGGLSASAAAKTPELASLLVAPLQGSDYTFEFWYSSGGLWGIDTGASSIREATGFVVTDADVRELADALGVDAGVREVMLGMAAESRLAYEREWVTLAERRADAVAEWYSLPGDEDDEAEEEVREVSGLIEALGERVRGEFARDLEMVLTAEQAERMNGLAGGGATTAVLRARTNVPLEAISPAAVVYGMGEGFSDREGVAAALAAYRGELAPLVASRDREAACAGEAGEAYQQAQRDDNDDRAETQARAAAKASVRAYNASVSIARLNVRTVDALRSLCTPDEAALLDELVGSMTRESAGREGADAGMMRELESYTERFSGMVETLERQVGPGALTGDQREAVAGVRERFEQVVLSLARELLRESAGSGDSPVMVSVRTGVGTVLLVRLVDGEPWDRWSMLYRDDAYDDAQKRVSRLEQRAIDELRGLLTMRQRVLLADL